LLEGSFRHTLILGSWIAVFFIVAGLLNIGFGFYRFAITGINYGSVFQTLLGVIAVITCVIVVRLYRTWSNVTLTPQSVVRRGRTGETITIDWADVTTVRLDPDVFRVTSAHATVRFAPHAFKNYRDLINYIAAHVPKTVNLEGIDTAKPMGKVHWEIFRRHGFDI
jgi:hypothetical protein